MPFSPNLDFVESPPNISHIDETDPSIVNRNASTQKSSGDSNKSLLEHFDLSPILPSSSGDLGSHKLHVSASEVREDERIENLVDNPSNVMSLESPRLAKLSSSAKRDLMLRLDMEEENDRLESLVGGSDKGKKVAKRGRHEECEGDRGSQSPQKKRKRRNNGEVSETAEAEKGEEGNKDSSKDERQKGGEDRRNNYHGVDIGSSRKSGQEQETMASAEIDENSENGNVCVELDNEPRRSFLSSVMNPVMALFRRRSSHSDVNQDTSAQSQSITTGIRRRLRVRSMTVLVLRKSALLRSQSGFWLRNRNQKLQEKLVQTSRMHVKKRPLCCYQM